MKLRRKTLIIVGVTAITLIGILYAVSQTIISSTVAKLEEQTTTQNVERFLGALSNELASLNATTLDYASWDDTYSFVQDININYINSNLVDTTFINLRLNVMLFVNSSGHIVFGKAFNLTDRTEIPVPQSLLEHLSTHDLLLRHESITSSVTGTVLLPEEPILVASRPILTSQGQGPINGALIMGRFLDSGEMSYLNQTAHLPFTMQVLSNSWASPDFQVANSSLSKGEQVFVQPLSTNSIAGYTLLRDIYGSPILLFRVDMPRYIYAQGQAVLSMFVMLIVVVGLVFAIVTVALLEKFALSRLGKLSAKVSSIGASGDLSARVSLAGRDELTILANEINNMLAAIERSGKALQESETRYRQITENMFDMVSLTDAEGTYKYVSPSVKRTLGYEPNDLLGKTIFDFLHPDDLSRVTEAVQTSIKNRVSQNIEYRYRHADGHYLWLEGSGNLVLDDKGQIAGAVLSSHDITERKMIEEQLRESEERSRSIAERSFDAIITMDLEGQVTFVSIVAERIIGYKPEEIIGKSFPTFLTESGISKAAQAFAEVTSGKSIRGLELEFLRKDGSLVIVEMNGAPIVKDGKVVGVQATARDISERKKMENTLRESEQKLRNVLQSSPDAIVVTDLNGNMVDCNQTALDLAGYSSKEEFIGKSTFTLIARKDYEKAMEDMKRLLEQGVQRNLEYNLIATNGREFPAEVSMSLLRDASGEPKNFVATIKDVTERKQMEQTLRDSEERFRAISTSARDIIVLMDGDGVVSYWNPAAERAFGYTKEEVVGKSAKDFFVPKEIRQIMDQGLQEFGKTGGGFMVGTTLELPATRKDGTAFPMELSISSFQMKGQWHALGIARDITERKKMEALLKESEERFRGITERSFDIIVTVGLDGLITYVSPSVERITSYRTEDIMGKPFQNLFAASKLPNVLEVFNEILQGKSIQGLEIETLRKDGSSCLFEVNVSPIMAKGEIVGIQAIARDISERKKMENKLGQANKRLQALLQTAREGIVTVDPLDNVTFANRAFADILGYTEEELLGLDLRTLVDEQGLKRIVGETESRKAGKISRYELVLYRKDGEPRTVQVTASPLWNEDGGFAGALGIMMDVTERKKMEVALRESQQKFERLFNCNPEASAFVDVNDCILEINPRFTELFGYLPEEAKGKALDSLIVPEAKREEAEALTKESMSGYIYHETIRRTKSGLSVPVLISAAPINIEGRFTGNVVSYRDITERKKMEEKIKESEERLKQLIEYAPDAIYVNDLNGNFVEGNRQAEEMTGYTKEEIIGKNMFEAGLLSEKYLSKAIEALEKNLRGERTGPDEFELTKKDGSKITVEISTFPVKREGNVEILGIARDITERKKMENALRESEEKIRNILQSSPDAITVGDLEGAIIDCNQADVDMFGYSTKEEMIGKNGFEFIATKDQERAAEVLMKAVDAGIVRNFQCDGVAKDGREFPIEISTSLVRDASGNPKYLVAIIKDVTERRQMLKKLEEYSQQLEEMVEKRTKQLKEAQEQLVKTERLAAIGQVAAMVGHDLRNPLTGIKGAAYYLKTKPMLKKDKKTMEMLGLIEKDIEYSNKIITDLLEYSREVHLELTETTPKSIITETLSLLEIPKNIQVENLAQDEPRIKIDIEKTNRVFVNLIKNAFDAMPYGGKLTMRSTITNANVEFTFTDTGMGMTKDQMRKTWTPFFTTKAKGMGLGLPICKRIVEAHGGHISVESMAGIGTTFTVTVPIEPKPTEGGEKVWVNVPESLSSTTTKA